MVSKFMQALVCVAGIAMAGILVVGYGGNVTDSGSTEPTDWPAFSMKYEVVEWLPDVPGNSGTIEIAVDYTDKANWSTIHRSVSFAPEQEGAYRSFEGGVFVQDFPGAGGPIVEDVPQGVHVAVDEWLSQGVLASLESRGFVREGIDGSRNYYVRREMQECNLMALELQALACSDRDTVEVVESYVTNEELAKVPLPVAYTIVVGEIIVKQVTVTALEFATE